MKQVLITGAKGFIGRNFISFLKHIPDIELMEFDIGQTKDELEQFLSKADIIFHLAGVNRPERDEEFSEVNKGLTEEICEELKKLDRTPKIVFSSSIQVERDNPYGRSKLAGEEVLKHFSKANDAEVVIYRLKNVFGKWCRPNYNSAVATFCHNIARDLPITISDPNNQVPLVYVDDVVTAFISELNKEDTSCSLRYKEVKPDFVITLGELVKLLREFKASRETLRLPKMNDPFISRLYATYISYLAEDDFAYYLSAKPDDRGSLAEFIKSPYMGQIFVSRTKPGITRGNHYHHTKVEKFLVLDGKAIIRFKHIEDGELIDYPISGEDYRVVDIPPGYTHSIENVGNTEMIVLFWAGELFDKDAPDTYAMPVIE